MARPQTHLVATYLLWATLTTSCSAWTLPQPKPNVWRTLAEALGQDHLCLNTAAAEDPMASCLVGIPLPPSQLPSPFNYIYSFRTTPKSPTAFWNAWRDHLRLQPTLEVNPPELHLLGSALAPVCLIFRYIPSPGNPLYFREAPGSQHPPSASLRYPRSLTLLNPSNASYLPNQWCKRIEKIPLATSPNDKAVTLPHGLFLICGNRAWAGIPSNPIGGPCALGRLSLFTPNLTHIIDWQNKSASLNSTFDSKRIKRDLKNLDEGCDSVIEHWDRTKATALTVLLPWVAIAKSLGELGRIECWVVKQANLTSAALTDLLYDEKVTRQATLQNRAAIDFLLLLHQHKCEEFEGLCCLNLSSRAEDARVSIERMQNHLENIKAQTTDWLGDMFRGWGFSNWVVAILKPIVYLCFSLILVLLAASILWKVLKNFINRALSSPEVLRLQAPPNSPEENSWEDPDEGDSMEPVDQELPYEDSEFEP
ncbi:uncharacterized protein LOC118684147 [Molothrus ater]|uniref:uncharacterized protein LOC118684147 n=1 Tax=Molothrus ater TaxID=84834 RepID=UPI00174D5101|nr:uncharacterized protein LOC118684147 [Molothrus ater]